MKMIMNIMIIKMPAILILFSPLMSRHSFFIATPRDLDINVMMPDARRVAAEGRRAVCAQWLGKRKKGSIARV